MFYYYNIRSILGIIIFPNCKIWDSGFINNDSVLKCIPKNM